jgi:cell division septum initiation protein DivIVA
MTLQPDAIDLEGLPRTIGGGLKREPVEELLNRVQWEYSQLYYEHKRLKEALGKRETEPRDEPKPASPALDPGTRARLEAADVAKEVVVEGARASAPVHSTAAAGREARPDVDDLARIVLASARQASYDLRESARRECELMFKNVRARIELLEKEFERTKALRVSELAELDATLLDVRAQMKAMLEVLSPPGPERAITNAAVGREDTGGTSALFPIDAEGTDPSQTELPSGVTAMPDAPDRTGLEAAS